MRHVRRSAPVLTVLLLAASPSWALPPRYEFTDLGSLGGGNTWPMGINNAGQVTGRSFLGLPSHAERAFLWQNGTMTELAMPAGSAVAQDINDRGQIVGGFLPANGDPGRAFVWENGQMRLLPGYAAYPEGGGSGAATAISESGIVVGAVKTGFSTNSPAAWAPDGTLTLLDTNGGGALGINKPGQIVGTMGTAAAQRAVVWQNGAMTDIASGRGLAINDKGQVVGARFTGSTGGRPFIYDNGRVTDLRTVSGALDFAQDVNNNGLVVGRFRPSPNVDHAFAWENGVFKDLNTLVNLQGLTLVTADSVNDAGQIVGVVTNERGVSSGYLLTPVPEPSSSALFAAGATLLLRRRRRTR